jgi:hypothetical protein
VNNPTCLSLETAERILHQFDEANSQCKQHSPERSLEPSPEQDTSDSEKLRLKKIAVQTALKFVIEQSDYQMLGICADSLAEGQQTLETYASAFNYELPNLDLPTIQGAVYLKYNSRTGNYYADGYPGTHRGVLVSCQSDFQDGLNAMYGHFPLNLFET